jgi:hypothetical protein
MLKSKSVEQLFAVLNRFKVRYSGGESVPKAHQGAVDDVRRDYDVTYQTIGDLCRRRLGLKSINEFHSLLEKWLSGDYMPLMEILKKNTKEKNNQKISEFFGVTSGPSFQRDVPKLDLQDESFTFRLRANIAKKLKVLSVMGGESLPAWLSKTICQVVEEQYKNWLSKQKIE